MSIRMILALVALVIAVLSFFTDAPLAVAVLFLALAMVVPDRRLG